MQKPALGEIPHITWCTSLPIHAAGLYDVEDGPKIFDYVVSSYVPNLATLLSAKRLPAQYRSTPLLLVPQPTTHGHSPPSGTADEAATIQMIRSSSSHLHVTQLDVREASTSAVLQNIRECNWVHLFCRGVQDVGSPTNSAFLLADGRLTLPEIMKQSFSHVELAVLLSGQTATGDKELPEEAMHLAAGMLVAGCRNVVATMWMT